MSQVIVLAGGASEEREVSLRSGHAVAKALEEIGHTVTTLDPAEGLKKFLPELRAAEVVFPALHGAGGEDGVLQKFLEDHRIAYVGSDSRSSSLCFDKARYTKLLARHGILTPASDLTDYQGFQHSELRQQPFVLKPNDGGSSIDTFIVRDPLKADLAAIQKAFDRRHIMLLQELINGTEITVPVVAERALPVIEIIPPSGGEFDYENKYNGLSQELCPPLHVSKSLQKTAQDLALRIHHLTGCRDLSRTDFIITAAGDLYTLETNTIPGLTAESLVPKAAEQAGMSMSDLCKRLVEIALRRNT